MLEAQLAEVVVNLGTADCIGLDAAGRLVISRVTDDIVTSGAIDSPLQNLAIYKQLMQKGYIGEESFSIALPGDVLDVAARSLGATSDKSGGINVDLVSYLNQIMGLTLSDESSILDRMCINVKEEVKGNIQLVQKCFLDYSSLYGQGHVYGYDRGANFSSLPAPAYIPASGPQQGWFEYLGVIPDSNPLWFQINQGPIMDAVFGPDTGGYQADIGAFVQAADDTRAVIDYMHNWPVPGDYSTPVPCGGGGNNETYDVSISEEFGLQVPEKMVDGTEGREFIVSVANQSSSPDSASGHVTVTAVPSIEGSPWTFEFDDLAPGASQSWTTFFSVNLGQATTINWTATAFAVHDVNTANNTVTATTDIVVTGGGKGK
jgi:hypothetical protein